MHIRQVRDNDNEWREFLRLLEASYGSAFNWFPRLMPQIFRRVPECLEMFWVLEEDSRIVSHVGLFPLELHVGDVSVIAGGIGGVATLPAYRGRGHMGRLLKHVIAQMKERGMPISVLWGQRRRYRRFGWECAGLVYEFFISDSTLGDTWEHPDPVRQIAPPDGIATMARLYTHGGVWTRRDAMSDLLAKPDLRMWIGGDGYLCGQQQGDTFVIHELFSSSGRELAIAAGVMKSIFITRAQIVLAPEDARLDAFCEAGTWQIRAAGCYRVNDSAAYLCQVAPLVARRLARCGAPAFSMLVQVDGPDEPHSFRIGYEDGRLDVHPSTGPEPVRVRWRDWALFLFGGPLSHEVRASLGPLALAFPLGLNVPPLDRI